ncbi:MAG: 16S rRNA (cytosine(1402)-N(4))-methyltransferase RsmH [Acidobacteria bacterium]|nr:MAG: 16S rRNA (cytosine(1402)-N(4))-methyltransferase RsmH [Acidobacteriota bacterium]
MSSCAPLGTTCRSGTVSASRRACRTSRSPTRTSRRSRSAESEAREVVRSGEEHRPTPPGANDGDGDGEPARLHLPVLRDRVVELFDVPELAAATLVDCTLGLGGHTEALLERMPRARLVGIDRDREALELASRRLQRFGSRFLAVHGRFDDIGPLLRRQGIDRVGGVLADLGVSSMQLDRADRGFSFRHDAPLDMRMDRSCGITAAELVNRSSEGDLVRILRDYGEERRARRIARAMVDRRQQAPIETTGELRDLVHRVAPAPPGRRTIDPATRTFQALRIEVNQELAGLRDFLDRSLEQLDGEGRLVVISYHSLEDRIVKHSLRRHSIGEVDPTTGRERAETRLVELLTKKPVRPSGQEVRANPRARSARLRAARRL